MSAAICLGLLLPGQAGAESKSSELVIRASASDSGPQFDAQAFESAAQVPRPLPVPRSTSAARAPDTRTKRLRRSLREVNFQAPPANSESELRLDLATNPCAAMDEKPLSSLGIGITLPTGKLPEEPATACWFQLNEAAGPLAAMRCWPTQVHSWDATCLCHRPLYFEQVNLERYGYGCCESVQPLASAAHFFATIPALPYCMAVECPCECVYTLGHYRPGSCPPRRYHWPPCSPLAAAAEGGVWTGLVFLIP